MGYCKRKGVECGLLTDYSVCNTDNCSRNLHDVREGFQLFIPPNDNQWGVAMGKPLQPNTLEIAGCENIILTPKGLNIKIDIHVPDFDKFEYLVINGRKFVRSREE